MKSELDNLLERWAYWVRSGGIEAPESDFQSGMMGKPELMIEAAMVALRAKGCKGKLVALVLSFEYGAITKNGLENAQQITKACALGMSLRSYYRKLREGKEHINKYIFQ